MYFADALLRAHSKKTEPHNLFDKDITLAVIDLIEDDLACVAKAMSQDKTLTEITKHTNTDKLRSDVKPYFNLPIKIILQHYNNILMKDNCTRATVRVKSNPI